MNIGSYMKEHEAYVKRQLLAGNGETDWEALLRNHERKIAAMQHERLLHLLVTLAFGCFLLVSLCIVQVFPSPAVYLLPGLFFIMLLFYVAHYFFLENTVQRWYVLTDEIVKKVETCRPDGA